GAGKTTTLRMLVGLITPTAGTMHLFGEPVMPGAPVLARVGAFIEGPGFLPHLSGRDNLRLYWAATGRPVEDAEFDTALDIAGLGGTQLAVDDPGRATEVLAAAGIAARTVPARRALEDVFLDLIGSDQ